ncbi:MAG TPA: M14 family zinc carboxypeptidase [Bacteroidales bacterium]|nr:M14 family zinc carboxypeptidase [Bacteroidales bacterium]
MKKLTYCLILLFISFGLKAQNLETEKLQQASQILQSRGEIVIKFNVATKAQINDDLTNIMSIDNVKELPTGQGYEVRAYANQQEFNSFLSHNIPYEIIPRSVPKAITMATTVAQMANWDRYPIYSVYEQMMATFASNYPNLCDIDTILSPTPSGNYRILVARISDNVNTPENEPQLLFSSSMHGDETTGYYLMLRMINYLLTNYGSITQVTNLVNGAEIWICPLANPDGTYYNSSPVGSTIANSRRYNYNNKDLNRNYIDPRIGDPSNSGDSYNYPIQPETYAFMDFADLHHFNFGANFHGGAEVMNYPWDTWTTSGNSNADRLWWEDICTDYVTTARQVSSSYMSDAEVAADGVTEGGDWYVITGGRQDYMNFYKHCREVTIELDDTKTTATENLQGMWNINYNSLLNLMQESLYGVRGIITDSCSGQPIRAKVWVNSYDQVNDSSQVYSALPVGNYHKYMIAGTYSITYSAPGYTSKTVNNVVLANGSATVVNVTLAPAASPDAQFTGTITDNCAGTVQFTNASTASTNFVWFFGDGTTSNDVNPTHSYTANGTYTVKLRALNCKGKDSLVMINYITINMAAAPATTGGSSCGAGTVSLSASGSGTLNWYDAASGGNLVNTGNSYSPTLSSTTTYYVSNSTTLPNEYVGKTNKETSATLHTNNSYYLIFSCYTPVVLKSVKVYAGAAGNRVINLRNSSNTVIQTTTVYIPAGESRINLNFNVPVGTDLQLATGTANPNMYRDNSGVSFPYNLAGKISITGTNAGSNLYYYYYDWEIETPGCTSPRSPVTAAILTLPTAGFNSSVSTYTATFTNTSINSTVYAWEFGDGGTSTQQHPVHTYAASGTYNVRLIATNGSCSDTIYHNVTIVAGSSYSITGKTRYLGKATAGIAPGLPTYNPAIYNISKVIVILKSSPAGIELARDTSNSQGVFQFNNIANGNYILSYDKYTADTMQICNDINAIDLAIMKYFVGHDTTTDPSRKFSAKYLKAANVDNNAAINSIDIARMSAKIGQPYTPSFNFPKGNWVALDTAITVAGANMSLTLKTIGYGDYNASSTSYKDSVSTWTTAKYLDKNDILISSEETQVINDPSYFEISLTSSNQIRDFAALGLELNYSVEDFKLVSATMPQMKTKGTPTKINPSLEEIIADNNDLLVTDDNGRIRVVFATTGFFDVKAHDTVITLGFISQNTAIQGIVELLSPGTGLIGDQYGNEVTDAYLMIPKVFVQNNSGHQDDIYFSGYPNPCNEEASIRYNLTDNGSIVLKVYNSIGEQVTELVNEARQHGTYETIFSTKNLPDGFYTLKLEIAGSKKSSCRILKMIIQHR